MKSLFARYRLSAALDSSPADGPHSEHPRDPDPIEANLHQIDLRLRQAPPAVDPPRDLHQSIMAAIRASNDAGVEDTLPHFRWSMWAPALGVAACMGLLLAVVLLNRPGLDNEHHSALLSTGSALTAHQVAPPAVVMDLSQELEDVENDLAYTVRHLAASLP